MKFELDYIEKLIALVEKSSLSELTLEDGERAMVLKRGGEIQTNFNTLPLRQVQNTIIEAPCEKKEEPKTEEPKGTPVTSPMVGTYYGAPSPNAKAFVQVGDTVATGQVVCIVEAMKLMNEIETEVSGKVTQICVKDGEAVEYGQVLMYIQ